LRWGTLAFNASTPSGTSVTVDVLNGSTDALLASAVATGTSLNALPAVASVSNIKLRANLATSDPFQTPELLDWSLTYPMVDGSPTESAWSATASSTQDATPPVLNVPALSTSSANATLTGTAVDSISGVANVTLGGTTVTTANGFANWNRNLVGLGDGPSGYIVTASDNAAPPNTASVIVYVYRIASPSADTNNDGISALMEHALGIPAGAINARTMLPAATIQTDSATGDKYLTMQFRRRIQRAGLSYVVETSNNLAQWDNTGAAVQEMSSTPTGDGVTETVAVRVTPAMNASNPKGFVRLRVSTN
jgi:hypothetical protein